MYRLLLNQDKPDWAFHCNELALKANFARMKYSLGFIVSPFARLKRQQRTHKTPTIPANIFCWTLKDMVFASTRLNSNYYMKSLLNLLAKFTQESML